MTFQILRPIGVLLLPLSLLLTGCTSDEDADATSSRIEFLSAQPLIGAGSIADAVESVAGGRDVVALRGRIGVGDSPAFEPDRAAFLMSEIIHDPNADGGHDVSSCPFCKRKLEKAPKAYIVLVNEDGSEATQRADEWLALRRDEIVQVRGKATFDESINTIKIEADALHKESATQVDPT